LELTILSDKKIAKIIELIEQLRRDHPGLADAIDDEAKAMSAQTDLQSVLDAIKRSHGRERD
jgi:hypothetical protein